MVFVSVALPLASLRAEPLWFFVSAVRFPADRAGYYGGAQPEKGPRGPKMAVPTRTRVAPSSMATSKS